LPIELTTEDIRNTKAYKEYYAFATGEATPKPKASARKKKRLSAAAKGKQPARATSPTDPSEIDEQEATESGEGDDEEAESDGESKEEETREQDKESFDPIPRTTEDGEDDGNGEENQGMESIFTTGSSTVTPIPSPKSTMTPSIITTTTTASQPPIPPTPIPSDIFPTLLTFVSAVREAVQIQTDRLQDFIQRENDEFLRTIDDNMKKIIKKQVKSQVKAQVTRILPRIEESVNAQLEAEVLTRSSHSSRTSYAVAADLSEMELKKNLIDKMEGNKSIQRSDEQRNLYKALVDAYDADKTILDT
nr:hypothetical protein [Tanacetum cinerariifolium]